MPQVNPNKALWVFCLWWSGSSPTTITEVKSKENGGIDRQAVDSLGSQSRCTLPIPLAPGVKFRAVLRARHAFRLLKEYHTNAPQIYNKHGLHTHHDDASAGVSGLHTLEIHPSHPSITWACVRSGMCPHVGGICPTICVVHSIHEIQ